jgi:DNA polymerase
MAGQLLVIDFETRSLVNLKQVGHAYYAAHPSTDVICAAGVLGDEPDVGLWVRGEPVPAPIIEACADPGLLFGAHNAAFEIAIWRHSLTPRYGWPECPPIERWRCSMAMASALALPPKLGKLAEVLGLTHRKADDHVMHLTCKPRRPRGDEDPNGCPYWFDDPEHLEQLYEYCRQDVRCERELFQLLPPLHPDEQKLWCLDQTINFRGFYTDGVLIERALAIIAAAEQAIEEEIRQITGGAIGSANQTAKLLVWLEAHDCKVGHVADNFQRRPELAHDRDIAGHDRFEFGLEVLGVAPEILWLRAGTGPPPGRRGVKLEGAADAAVDAVPVFQRLELVGGGVRCLLPQFDDAANLGRQTFARQRLFQRALPSGRALAYPFVELITNGKGFPAVSFMDNQLGKWAPVRYGQGVWGGTFTENLTQAIARDHLAAALLRLEAAGYPVVLHVHDSICVEVPDGSRDV